jgi:hypothetical protein
VLEQVRATLLSSFALDIHPPRLLVRAARIVALAIIIGMAIGYLYWAVAEWKMPDAEAYWNAAMRLRHGQELFPVVPNVEASDVFRYSPWFAWLTVPFTFLPIQLAGAIWSAILIGASTLAVMPMVRKRAWLGVVLFWPILIAISTNGNVQALIIAALVLGVERRSGALWIAAAASLKAFPLLFVLIYIGRREWAKAAVTVTLTAVLVAPFLLYPLEHYPTSAGGAAALYAWPVVYAAVVGMSVVATLLLAGTRYSWLTGATTTCLALPRFFLYDITYLVVATATLGTHDGDDQSAPAARQGAAGPPHRRVLVGAGLVEDSFADCALWILVRRVSLIGAGLLFATAEAVPAAVGRLSRKSSPRLKRGAHAESDATILDPRRALPSG